MTATSRSGRNRFTSQSSEVEVDGVQETYIFVNLLSRALDCRKVIILYRAGENIMVSEFSQTPQELPQDCFLTEEEDLAIKENLARTQFGMSLSEFTKAWKAGEFDDDQERHGDVISLAMMLPEYWTG